MNKIRTVTTSWRKLLRFLLYFLCALLLLVVLTVYALTLPAVQQRLTRTTESFLQKKLGTRVEIGAIRVRFPFLISAEKLLVEDQQGDKMAMVGRLSVSMNMWALLDQTIELQQITLEDARVYLHQKDSSYNFDFVTRAFASADKPVPVDTTASPWSLQLNLAVLQLSRVDFLLQDDDAISTTKAYIGAAKTKITKADVKALDFELEGFSLADADIRLIQQKKSVDDGKPDPSFSLLLKTAVVSNTHLLYSTTERTLDATLENTKLDNLRVNAAQDAIAIQSNNVSVVNSVVLYQDPAATPTPGHFNAGDLDIHQLNAEIPAFSFQNDTLWVQANALSGSDKSGLLIHSMRATAHVTPGSINIRNAMGRFNQTSLDGDVLLFKNDKATFDRMQVHLRQVKGIIGDLIVVLPPQTNPALSRLQDIPYEVSGQLNGWLGNLQTEDIRFRSGSGTVAYFNGSVQNLTELDKLGMRLNIVRLETNRADLIRWMSVGESPKDSLLAQPLPAFISISGLVDGTVKQLQLTLGGEVGAMQSGPIIPFVASPPLQFDLEGTLTNVTDIDQLAMELQLQNLEAPRQFFTLWETKDIQMPDLLRASGTMKGTLAALQVDLKLVASRSGANSHLAFKGLLKQLRTPDKLGFDVIFDASLARQELLGYVADSTITKTVRLPNFVTINGQASGTVKEALGKVEIGLGGMGEMILEGTLSDSVYQFDMVTKNLRVAQLAVDSALFPLKTLSLKASITGEGFQIGQTARAQLAGNVDSLIWDNVILRDITFDADIDGKRFKGGFQSPDPRFAVVARATGDFTTAIPLLETDITLNCIDLREFGWGNRPTTVCMHIVSRTEGLSVDTLTAHVLIEKIDLQYDTVHIYPGDLNLDVTLDNRHNNITIQSDWLQGEIKGYFNLEELSSTVGDIAAQYFVVDRTAYIPPIGTDSLSVQLQLLQPALLTTGLIPGLTGLGPIYIEGTMVAPRRYFNLQVKASQIVYRDWEVDSLHVRSYAGDTAALFVMTSPLVKRGKQDFIENAVLNGRFLGNVADVSFKASSDDGRDRFLLELQAMINNKTKEVLVKCAPRQVIDYKEWAVNPDHQIRIAPGGVEVRTFTLMGAGQSIKVDGATKKLAANKTGLDFSVDIERLNYNNFDIFVTGVVRELEGWAEAHLSIKGSTDDLQVRGSMQLHETSFTPVLTNVHYQLSETPILFTASGVVLDGLTLRDPFDKVLKINGKLSTTDWNNVQSNLTLDADEWQVLNSTKRQNPVYFGELFVSLKGTVKGPVSQPDIHLVVRTDKESSFTYIYDAAAQALQHEGIVYFLPPPRQYVRPPVYDAPVNSQPFTLSASIEIDSNLTVNSVINPVTGDDFRGKAIGRLQFDMLANGNMTLTGRMELVRGVYNYSYQSVVKRSFEVTTGSTITWTGDVRAPELDLKARYKFKASPYPLVVNQLSSASPDETATYRRPQTFFLQTSLNGAASQPEVSFQFIYAGSERQEGLNANFGNQQTGLVQSALSNVNQDQNLLSRQVFGVLLLKNFIGESFGTTTTIGGGNPLQSGLSSFLTGQLNALADQYLTWIDVDLATTEGATNTGAGQAEGTTNYQLRLQKSFFEDRLTFKLSGGTSVGGQGGDDVQSALENASIEYALTPKGEFKVTVFSERGIELLNSSSSNLRNSGAGFILSREFGGNHE